MIKRLLILLIGFLPFCVQAQNNVRLYPEKVDQLNFTQNTFEISKTENDQNSQINKNYRIYNLSGQMLMEKRSNVFDNYWLSEFPIGFYIIQVNYNYNNYYFVAKNDKMY